MASTVDNVDIIDYVMLLIYCHWLSLVDRDCPAGSVRSTLCHIRIWLRESSIYVSDLSARLCVVDVFC